MTTHGRATPLLWKTVSSKNIKGKKNNHVKELLFKLRQLAPKTCEVIVLADREFGTLKTMKYLREMLGFHYILRIKRNFTVTSSDNKKRLAHEWISGEETKSIDNAKITVKDYVFHFSPGKFEDYWRNYLKYIAKPLKEKLNNLDYSKRKELKQLVKDKTSQYTKKNREILFPWQVLTLGAKN